MVWAHIFLNAHLDRIQRAYFFGSLRLASTSILGVLASWVWSKLSSGRGAWLEKFFSPWFLQCSGKFSRGYSARKIFQEASVRLTILAALWITSPTIQGYPQPLTCAFDICGYLIRFRKLSFKKH